jgi:hypothetical protein
MIRCLGLDARGTYIVSAIVKHATYLQPYTQLSHLLGGEISL